MDQRSVDNTFLGIELGSTRIKAVLIGGDYAPLVSGSHDWENDLIDGVWTYSLNEVWAGLQDSFAKLSHAYQEQYGAKLTRVGGIGISGMMHGYLPFDSAGTQLVPFRTWRNTMTEQASKQLTSAFGFHIPQRWSIAHLYQAILNKEPHVEKIGFLTTLAGYVHWKLTGETVLGIGDASGVVPIDEHGGFDQEMIRKFDSLTSNENYSWRLADILPDILPAGEQAGALTKEGALLLDPSGALEAGISLCPPEGDAGTGMVATNSVAERTGNISAGTSIFAMIVLEKALSKVYPEIDMVTTPAGRPVAMVHCNNCTSDLDAWVGLFGDFAKTVDADIAKSALYDALYESALKGAADGGGLLSYNYFSGEHLTELDAGRPLLTRQPDSKFTLANLMRTLIYSTMGTLKLGMDILTVEENVRAEQLTGHGGLFKTPKVGQTLMAGALGIPIAVMESAGEGGAWGIALLAAYMGVRRPDESLDSFLNERVFGQQNSAVAQPQKDVTDGFAVYMERYKKGLPIERAAVECLTD